MTNDYEELTDVFNANLFSDTYENELKYSSSLGIWYRFNGVIWQKDDQRYVIQLAIECTKNMLLDSAQLLISAAKIRDKDKRDLVINKSENLTKHAKSSQRKNRLEAMISIASTDKRVSVDNSQFDSDDWLLAVQNGVVELENGNFRPATSNDLLTKQAATNFLDGLSGVECKVWLEFLSVTQPDPEIRSWLQRFAGYCLTGRIDEQILTIFYGGGANGKSVFVEALKGVLGSYATQAQFDTFCERRNDGIRNDIARLDKIRLVVASEGSEGARLDESIVKQITGGDEITARFLHREFFTFLPKFKIVLVTNHKPIINGSDHGIWRRVVLVPWSVTIPAEKCDKRLLDKLNMERQGILNWALKGLEEYLVHGLALPKPLIVANSDYRKDCDLVGVWIDDCCITEKHCKVTSSALYSSYKNWAVEYGHRVYSSKSLSDKLIERGFERTRTNTGRGWIGLGLRVR